MGAESTGAALLPDGVIAKGFGEGVVSLGNRCGRDIALLPSPDPFFSLHSLSSSPAAARLFRLTIQITTKPMINNTARIPTTTPTIAPVEIPLPLFPLSALARLPLGAALVRVADGAAEVPLGDIGTKFARQAVSSPSSIVNGADWLRPISATEATTIYRPSGRTIFHVKP